ncbi:MAG: serine/threonine-protein kinase, partial [Planctomycetota bacterium]
TAGAGAAADGGSARERLLTGTAAPEDLVGGVLGGCRIEKILGRGGMGIVFLAQQLTVGRPIALKVIPGQILRERQAIARFRQEARAAGRLSSPFIIQIHEVGADAGWHYLILEYAPGGNLSDRAAAQGSRLGSGEALRFLEEAAEGLLEAERAGVIHRDLKPENLLIGAGDRLKIADFGIAKLLDADTGLTTGPSLLGTPLYMSPEQCAGVELDHRSDIYSLGATFYRLLTGSKPVSAGSVYELIQKKMQLEHLSPGAAEDSVTPALNALIEGMTARDREKRPEGFRKLLEEIRRLREA